MTHINPTSDLSQQRTFIGVDPTYAETEPHQFGAFPAGALNTPMFEPIDVAGLLAAAAITLGPLAAYSFGFGA